MRIARRASAGTVYYYFGDHLGTSRVMVQAGQNTACYEADFYPFGGERVITSTCAQNYKFTGKERDGETGNDYFGARYYASNLGRFLTVDPSGGSPNPEDPQSWNRYAYALNNPLFYIDPDGADSISAVYRLGTASVHHFVQVGPELDFARMLPSISGTHRSLRLQDLQQNQPMAAPSPYTPGGGCVLGCISTFNVEAVSVAINLSFNYDPETHALTGANIQFSIDSGASFVGPHPPLQVAAALPLPGMTPDPAVFAVNIDSSVLRQLSSAQLSEVRNATFAKKDPVSKAILKAVGAEEQRRAKEQRKKDEAPRKEKESKKR